MQEIIEYYNRVAIKAENILHHPLTRPFYIFERKSLMHYFLMRDII